MSKKNISEALCAMPGSVVELRHKSVLLPVLMILAGAILFVLDSFIKMTESLDSLKMVIMLMAVTLVICGIIWGIIRAKGEGELYHVDDKTFLTKKTLKFTKDKKSKIVNLVNSKDFATLHNLSEDTVSGLLVEMYQSPKSGFCAVCLFEYVEMQFQPITDVQIVEH